MHWKDIILILSHQKPLVTSLSLIFLCDSCMHEIKVVFLLLFNVSLIIGPAKKPTKEEGKIFLPLKTLILRKTEGRRRRGRQDEMVGWHHPLNGRA